MLSSSTKAQIAIDLSGKKYGRVFLELVRDPKDRNSSNCHDGKKERWSKLLQAMSDD